MSLYFKRGAGGMFGFGMASIVVYFPLSRELVVQLGLKAGEVEPPPATKTWNLTLGWYGLW